MDKRIVTRLDVIILISAMFVCVGLFVIPKLLYRGKLYAVMYSADGEMRVSLNEDREFAVTSNAITLDISVKKGTISVTDANCRDRLCINRGTISNVGECIICLPARVYICIKAEGESEVDAVL